MPALFWAFVASSTTTDSAKRGYAMIATCTQDWHNLRTTLISTYGARFGLPAFFAVSGLLVFVVPMIISFYSRVMPEERVTKGPHHTRKKRVEQDLSKGYAY